MPSSPTRTSQQTKRKRRAVPVQNQAWFPTREELWSEIALATTQQSKTRLQLLKKALRLLGEEQQPPTESCAGEELALVLEQLQKLSVRTHQPPTFSQGRSASETAAAAAGGEGAASRKHKKGGAAGNTLTAAAAAPAAAKTGKASATAISFALGYIAGNEYAAAMHASQTERLAEADEKEISMTAFDRLRLLKDASAPLLHAGYFRRGVARGDARERKRQRAVPETADR